MTALLLAALAISALLILWLANILMQERQRARRRRELPRIKRVDVPAEWAHLEQREYLPRIFTLRLGVALLVTGLAVVWPWVALLVSDSDAFFKLWVVDEAWIEAWLSVPEWWVRAVVASLVVNAIVAMLIMRGHLCPTCRARLVKWTSPIGYLTGGAGYDGTRGKRVLLMCPSCQIVYQAPWAVCVTGRGTVR